MLYWTKEKAVLIIFRKTLAFFICLAGVLLPWRLRCYYSEALGWLTQFLYLNYVSVLNLIVRELGREARK